METEINWDQILVEKGTTPPLVQGEWVVKNNTVDSKTNREARDKILFESIGEQYAKKDFDFSTRRYRDFTNKFLINSFLSNRSGKFLDIGCGAGAVSRLVDLHKFDYIGVDYSSSLIKVAKENFENEKVRFYCEKASTLDLGGTRVDVVFMNGVLHHMPNVAETMRALKNNVKPGSILIAIEPSGTNPIISLMRYLRTKIDSSYSSEQTFFKKSELRRLLCDHLNELSLWEFGYLTPPFAQVAVPGGIGKLLYPVATLFDQMMFKINRIVPMNLTWNVIAVGYFK